jgi:hypothetical protein
MVFLDEQIFMFGFTFIMTLVGISCVRHHRQWEKARRLQAELRKRGL